MKKILMLFITALTISSVGCNVLQENSKLQNESTKGSITIDLSKFNNSSKFEMRRSILPDTDDTDMEISTFDISGIGPGATFEKNGISETSQSVTIDNLLPGSWAVSFLNTV